MTRNRSATLMVNIIGPRQDISGTPVVSFLTHLPLDKMAASQTTFPNAFS